MTDTETVDTVDFTPLKFVSTDSTATLYACRLCRLVLVQNPASSTDAEALARDHCRCGRCRIRPRESHYTYCADCKKYHDDAKEQRRREKLRALPVVELGADDWVYVVDTDRFYEDDHQAADYLADDGVDPTTVIAHPCTKTKLAVPSLAEWVDEAWGSEFSDESWDGLDQVHLDAIEAATKVLTASAPTCYVPRTRERIVLPSIAPVAPETS